MQIPCNVPQLWLAHKDALGAYIRKRVRDPEQVNDLLQEVLLKVYKSYQHVERVRNERAWLFRIAQHTIIDAVRKNRRLIRSAETPDLAHANEREAYQDAAEYILPMINLLPPRYAEPLRLADVEGMKQHEVAKELNLGFSATKSRIQRAREMLRDLFTECCDLETDEKGRLLAFEIKPGCRSLQTYKQRVIQASG